MTPIEAQLALLRAALQRHALRISDLEARLETVEDQTQRHVMIMDAFAQALSEMRRAEIELAATGGRDDGAR